MTAKGSSENVTENVEEVTDESMTNLSLVQYNDRLDTHQILLQTKNAELTRLTEMLRNIRESKEPLTQVKATLQAEINESKKAINSKTEEVTLIKQKLRYHSVKQITENIERLEYQLRNNYYKPREEQKILDEISMLQRSIKTLREYEAKKAENMKYRAERGRLIDERNNVYAHIKGLLKQEEDIKKAMSELRGVISANKKTIEQLRQIKPNLEKKWSSQQQQQQQQQVTRNKRPEEKRRPRQEHFRARDRQETRRRVWDKYEVSREPYEEECDLARVLISYLQSSMNNLTTPSSLRPTPTTPLETPKTPTSDPDYIGSFYMKPKDEDGFIKVSKREKAKVKRELRLAKRVKDLAHTPDVLHKFTKLSVPPPKNTDEIPAAVIALQDALQHYHNLYMEAKRNYEKKKSTETNTDENQKCVRPTSLAVNPPQLIVSSPDTFTPGTLSSFTSLLLEPTAASQLGRSKSLPVSSASTPLKPEITYSPRDQFRALENRILPKNSNAVVLNGYCLESPLDSNMPSPTLSWAAIATIKHKNPKVIPLCEVPPVQPLNGHGNLCNGVQSPEIINESPQCCVLPSSEPREEPKLSNGILTLRDNESFFSSPISYSSNSLVEVEVNNNAPRSYANVTAKLKASAADF